MRYNIFELIAGPGIQWFWLLFKINCTLRSAYLFDFDKAQNKWKPGQIILFDINRIQIKHNLFNKMPTTNRVSSRENLVNLSFQPSLYLCKTPFGDRTNKNLIVNKGSPISMRKRNPADCHCLFDFVCGT